MHFQLSTSHGDDVAVLQPTREIHCNWDSVEQNKITINEINKKAIFVVYVRDLPIELGTVGTLFVNEKYMPVVYFNLQVNNN